MRKYIFHGLLLSVGLVGAAAPIHQARGETAPSAEADQPEQQPIAPSSPDGSAPRANEAHGDHNKAHGDHNKGHRHRWTDELRKQLQAQNKSLRKRLQAQRESPRKRLQAQRESFRKRLQAQNESLRKRLQDLKSMEARGLGAVQGAHHGEVDDPARSAPAPAATSSGSDSPALDAPDPTGSTNDVPDLDEGAAPDAPADKPSGGPSPSRVRR